LGERFITCRLPDDEDSVTFTFMDEHEAYASRWAEAMLLFEPVVQRPSPAAHPRTSTPQHHHNPFYRHGAGNDADGPVAKQLHVRRLWNRAHLLKRLEELRRATPPPLSPSRARSRVGSPAVWGNGVVNGVNGINGVVNGVNGGRMPVALTVPGVVQRGDIWW
jgi:hypothetical protein